MQRPPPLPNETEADFDPTAFLADIAPMLAEHLGGTGPIIPLQTRAGSVNLIVKFSYGGRVLGARIALDRTHFRYERDLVKEVFAVSLLKHAGERIDDERASQMVDGLLAMPKGAHLAHDLVRPILYYDWTMAQLPFPFFIFEWIEGAVLWEQPFADDYFAAGKLLAELHRVRFEHFYENIFAIHHTPRSWRDHMRVCLNRELARADLTLPAKLVTRFNRLDLSNLQPGIPCLIHNNFSGANIVVDAAGRLHAIDWDNWVVDCPELDLVKMKYWTAIGSEGHLAHRTGLYDAFVSGYKALAGHIIDERRQRAYEYLWLLRCFNYESAREGDWNGAATATNSWRQVYPNAAYYRDLLQDL